MSLTTWVVAMTGLLLGISLCAVLIAKDQVQRARTRRARRVQELWAKNFRREQAGTRGRGM